MVEQAQIRGIKAVYLKFVFFYLQARVQVTDINDTPPRFSKNFYSVDVPEDIQLDATVITLTFTDDDTLGGLKLTLNPEGSVNLRIDQNGE